MSFVIDASVVIAWAFKEEHANAELTFERIQAEEAIVPPLWWYEVRNVLVLGERHGRLTERETARFLRDISRFAINIDRMPSEHGVLTLARRHGLTVYDAAYLELAQRGALPLATLDQALASAARAEGVSLVGHDI